MESYALSTTTLSTPSLGQARLATPNGVAGVSRRCHWKWIQNSCKRTRWKKKRNQIGHEKSQVYMTVLAEEAFVENNDSSSRLCARAHNVFIANYCFTHSSDSMKKLHHEQYIYPCCVLCVHVWAFRHLSNICKSSKRGSNRKEYAGGPGLVSLRCRRCTRMVQ